MITEVGTPNQLSIFWRNYIQINHEQTFGYRMHNIDDHWWYVEMRHGEIAGFAGMKKEAVGCIFIGPCIINEKFRRLGLQKKLIRHRESKAKLMSFHTALSYTHYLNYTSANNFIRTGYVITKPWYKEANQTGDFIYWKKYIT